MNKIIVIAIYIFIITLPSVSFCEDIYVSQNAQGSDNGANCSNTHSTAWFDTSGNWANPKVSGKIGPGDTVHLCGTITTSLQVHASGLSGNPITILFEPGAKISEGTCASGGCFSTNGQTYLIVDGGTDGTIEATNNGTGLGVTPSVGINAMQCSNCEIKNLNIINMYVRTSDTDTLSALSPNDASSINAIDFSGSNISIHDNVIHDVGWALRDVYTSTDDNVRIYSNDISRCGHALAIAASDGSVTNGSFYYYDNYVHDFGNWDSPGCSVAHTSAIHAYGINGSKITGTLWIYDNKFEGSGSCMTADIYLEGNAGSAWTDNTGSAKIFNNYMTASGYVTGLVQPYNGTNIEIYNNTIIGNGESSTICLEFGGTSTDVTVENNFIGNCGFLISAYAGEAVDPGLNINYNVYADCSGYNCFWVGSTDTGSFSAYRSRYPNFDMNSIDSTASSGGLLNGVPQSGSPVIDSGNNLTGLRYDPLDRDISGQVRPQSTPWCVGAYEFRSVLPPTDLAAY